MRLSIEMWNVKCFPFVDGNDFKDRKKVFQMTENSSSCLCFSIQVGKKMSIAASVTVFGLVWTKTRHQKVQLRPIFWHFHRRIFGLTVLKQHLFRELCANEPVRSKRLRRSYGKPRKKHVSLMFYDRSLTSSAWCKTKKKTHTRLRREGNKHTSRQNTHSVDESRPGRCEAEGLTLKI